MLLAIAAAAVLQTATPAEPPFDAAARVTEAVEMVRPVAYRSAQVDWPALEAEMLRLARDANDTVDMLPAYHALVAGLGDGHSFIQPPRATMAAWRERHGAKSYDPNPEPDRSLKSAFHRRRAVEHRDLGAVRLVVVPAFAGDARSESAETYADAVFRATVDAPPATCGYIVDLRGNTGGNFWPMVMGLSGLLGEGPQGLYRDAEGRDSAYARLSQGKAIGTDGESEGAVIARVPAWRPAPGLAQRPVAVLVDDATASSGEGVALAFVGRPNTRSFGAQTYGVASANNGFRLSDGVNLVITVAMMVDPTGQTHPEGYRPDLEMEADDEQVVEAASAWLSTQPACQG